LANSLYKKIAPWFSPPAKNPSHPKFTLYQTIPIPVAEIHSMDLSPDSLSVAVSCRDFTLKMYDLKHAKCTGIFRSHTDSCQALKWSHDKKYLISASRDKTIKIWNTKTKKCISTLIGHQKPVISIDLSPCQKYIASGSGDGTVRIWEWKSSLCTQILLGHCN